MYHSLVALLICLILLLLLYALAVRTMADSTCMVVYGSKARWRPLAAGFLDVYPNAEVIVMPEPEIDFVAYCDALQDCSNTYKRLLCQLPCQAAADIVKRRRGTTVTVYTLPSYIPPNIACNIVQSEQRVADVLLELASKTQSYDKKILISSTALRSPGGWMNTVQSSNPQTALQQLTSLKISCVVVSYDITETDVQNIRLAAPEALVLASTSGSGMFSALYGQVTEDLGTEGKLAGIMLKGNYKGPRDIVVDPLIIKPKDRDLINARVTSIQQLVQRC